MTKQELRKEVIEMMSKSKPVPGEGDMLVYVKFLRLIDKLDEPPQEPCEIKEFAKPRYPKDKKLIKYYGCSICEYDLGSLQCDTNFCPNCGRKIRE